MEKHQQFNNEKNNIDGGIGIFIQQRLSFHYRALIEKKLCVKSTLVPFSLGEPFPRAWERERERAIDRLSEQVLVLALHASISHTFISQ